MLKFRYEDWLGIEIIYQDLSDLPQLDETKNND